MKIGISVLSSMPIKDYTTKIPAARSIQEIQELLLKHGATGFMMMYEKGTGRISALKFILDLGDKHIPFQLPVDWRAFQRVLKEQQVKRWDEEDYCYRVAWRNIYHWVDSQCALYETQMVQIAQVFLPYAVTEDGSTIFEKIASNPKLLLG